jgi:hypothetical protein
MRKNSVIAHMSWRYATDCVAMAVAVESHTSGRRSKGGITHLEKEIQRSKMTRVATISCSVDKGHQISI